MKEEVKQKLKVFMYEKGQDELIKVMSSVFDIEIITYDNLRSKMDIDLIIFGDGEPIDMRQFGLSDKPDAEEGTNPERDQKEQDMWYNFSLSKPKLGIGRGALMISLLSGARVLHNVKGHVGKHTIRTEYGNMFNVESNHEHLMDPYNLSQDRFKVSAWSTYFLSKTYTNAFGEPVTVPVNFLEAEIVKYSNTNSLCIQANPVHCDEKFQKQFNWLVKKLVESKGWKREEFERMEEELLPPEEPRRAQLRYQPSVKKKSSESTSELYQRALDALRSSKSGGLNAGSLYTTSVPEPGFVTFSDSIEPVVEGGGPVTFTNSVMDVGSSEDDFEDWDGDEDDHWDED